MLLYHCVIWNVMKEIILSKKQLETIEECGNEICRQLIEKYGLTPGHETDFKLFLYYKLKKLYRKLEM